MPTQDRSNKGMSRWVLAALIVAVPAAPSYAANGSSDTATRMLQRKAEVAQRRHQLLIERESAMSGESGTRVTVIRDRIKRNRAVISQSGSNNTTTMDQGGSNGAIEVDQVGKGNRALIRQNPTGTSVVISQD